MPLMVYMSITGQKVGRIVFVFPHTGASTSSISPCNLQRFLLVVQILWLYHLCTGTVLSGTCSTGGVFLAISKFLNNFFKEWNSFNDVINTYFYSTLFNIENYIYLDLYPPSFSRRKMFKILLNGIQYESYRV